MPSVSFDKETLESPLAEIVYPIRSVLTTEITGGVLLLAATVVAVAWANSPWGEFYFKLWETPLLLSVGEWETSIDLRALINEFLITIFFFAVGLDIKCEFVDGDLSTLRKASLPVIAAIGGMCVPALIYLTLNRGSVESQGWAIPIATDIVFVVAILTLFKSRISKALRAFVLAIAVVDDIGAVSVIAVVHSSGISPELLFFSALTFLLLLFAGRQGVRHPLVYTIFGLILWILTLKAGIHPTVAGVLVAVTVPARSVIGKAEFVEKGKDLLDTLDQRHGALVAEGELNTQSEAGIVKEIETGSVFAQNPLARFLERIEPLVDCIIVPLFALANAGVILEGAFGEAALQGVTLGIIAGLVIGKPVGIVMATWISSKLGLSEIPPGIPVRHLWGAGFLCGIGFTMSLVMNNLVFEHHEGFLAEVKIAVLLGSLLAAATGSILLTTRIDPKSS
ncbi:MAG: Na+/H+ antiporter NhaA [Bdellovibrionales bacterium]|nr:Na+/H+ antiporter NhaA [Bdellovibrionales bacterium]